MFAKITMTFMFWVNGVTKIFYFDYGIAEMANLDPHPAILFNNATISVQMLESILVIANRLAWLGAGAPAVFTGLTIILVHSFWSMTEEPFRSIAFHTATEHIGIIRGLVAISIVGSRRASADRRLRGNRLIDHLNYG